MLTDVNTELGQAKYKNVDVYWHLLVMISQM